MAAARADHHARQRNAQLDEGQVDLRKAQAEADHHHADEAQRHQPQRPPAEHIGKHADGDHGQHVVETADGMLEDHA